MSRTKRFPNHFYLEIFGKEAEVSVVDNKTLHAKGLAGEFCRRSYKINICDNQTGEDKWHTLIHEVTHAIIARVGLTQVIDPEVEEILAESVATAITENFILGLKD